jgi:c-di-GMP-binding flagellar brake protein YcgR
MTSVERRRSARIPAFQEEAAVIQSGGRELPVKIVDLSSSGALLSVLDMPALGSRNFEDDEQVELSIQKQNSVFHVMCRVVRTGPLFMGVEFIEQKAEVQKKLDEKLLEIRARGAIGSA